MTETALVRAGSPAALPAITPVRVNTAGIDLFQLCRALAASGYFQDAKQEAQAVVKVLYGAELGISPVQSMLGIHVISGKPCPSAGLIASAIKRSGKYDYRVVRWENEVCALDFYERGERIGPSEFTAEDAKTAGLLDGPNAGNWKKYRRNMLFARALTNGARVYCADIFGGPVYTPEEMNIVVDGETGEVIDTRALAPLDPESQGDRRAAQAMQAGETSRSYAAATIEKPAPPPARETKGKKTPGQVLAETPPETEAEQIRRLRGRCAAHLTAYGQTPEQQRAPAGYFARVLEHPIRKPSEFTLLDWQELERRLHEGLACRGAYFAAWQEFCQAFGVAADDRVSRLNSTASLIQWDGALASSSLLTPREYARAAEALRERAAAKRREPVSEESEPQAAESSPDPFQDE